VNGNARNDNTQCRRTVFIRRHALSTRLTHWLNALCLSFLLLSGLQIFNAHPELYWGHYGADGDHTALTIGSQGEGDEARGFVRVAGVQFATTGVLGVSDVEGEPTSRAFPAWATIPSFQDLAAGRRWHFFFAWLFLINGIFYFGFSVLNGHFRRDLAPTTRELSPRHLWREVLDHARLRFPEGEEPETEWTYAEPTGENWGSVLAQDFSNMEFVQKGMKSSGFRGPLPNPHQEQKVINLHRNLADFMGRGAVTRVHTNKK